jgi:hypothetical protein
MNKNSTVENTSDAIKMIQTRLDAIVLLLLSLNKSDDKKEFKLSEAAPLLHTAGYSPTEIAKLFGKKKPQEIAPYLYKKAKKAVSHRNGL